MRKILDTIDVPDTLDKFQDLKYNRSKEFRLLKGYRKAVGKGDIPALTGMEVYTETARQIEEKLIGLKTVDGMEIKDYSVHFIDRTIGQYESSEYEQKGKRRGVKPDDVVEALIQPVRVSQIKSDCNGRMSVTYTGSNCEVSVNPVTKELIQTNPTRRKSHDSTPK